MSPLIIFLVSFCLGIALRILYRLTSMLIKHTNILAVTIILDAILGLVMVLSYACVLFFMCDGQIFIYSIYGMLIGFMLVSMFF